MVAARSENHCGCARLKLHRRRYGAVPPDASSRAETNGSRSAAPNPEWLVRAIVADRIRSMCPRRRRNSGGETGELRLFVAGRPVVGPLRTALGPTGNRKTAVFGITRIAFSDVIYY